MKLLADKVALVTGGSQGLGEAHVRKLHEDGAKVIITDVLVDNGEKLAKELGDNATFVKLDVTDPDAWDAAIEHGENTFGPIDILVNNAGIDIMKPFIEFTGADLQKLLDVNLFGNFYGMQKSCHL